MSKTALLFPGQGAQAVGMGKDVYESFASARTVFEEADKQLGFALSEIIFQGPEEQLKQTMNTQPALLTVSIALLRTLNEMLPAPIAFDYAAGHSLGEYSALTASGALSFADAVTLVRARGQYMEEAVPAGEGAMAAVLGAERSRLESLCTSVSAQIGAVELANVNCPGQIVVSGSAAGVQAVVEQGKEAGAKRVLPLAVSGPFHSSLMQPAADKLSELIGRTAMAAASVPIISNVTAAPVEEPAAMRELLVRQVVSPVLWEDSMKRLLDEGVDTFIEIGSGSVLTGLMKKIDRSVKSYTLNSVQALQEFVQEWEG